MFLLLAWIASGYFLVNYVMKSWKRDNKLNLKDVTLAVAFGIFAVITLFIIL